MEELLSEIITGLPNLAVALIMLYWQRQTIKELMDNQSKLIDRLLSYVDRDKQRVDAQIATKGQDATH